MSILVVSWNAGPHLSRCLASLDAARHEVILVDNASDDGSAEAALGDAPAVAVIRHAENRGFSAGVNAAAARAHGRFLLLLNPDVEAVPGSIDRLAAFLDAHPDHGAVAGRLIDDQGRPQDGFAVRRFPTLASWAADLLLIDKLWPGNPASRRYLGRDLDLTRAQDVEQPAAACLMLRREAFDTLGGLDERFFPAWFEDVDLCRRLIDLGWRIGYTPEARFTHAGGVAMRALGLAAFSQIWYRNLLRYADKHHTTGTRAALRGLIVVGMCLRAGVSLVTGRSGDARAYLRVLRDVTTAGSR